MLDAINTPTHVLSKDGKEQFRGTENNCYYKLQRLQGQSADWAIRHEGWRITEAELFDNKLDQAEKNRDRILGLINILGN